jgi:hypothetical protein
VPGVIGNEDPGDSGFHGHVSMTVSRAEDDTPTLDVESYVDRLRFMGLDRDLVDEAEHRVRADVRIGMRWVTEQLKALTRPRRPPTCDCGEALVDTAWRGRATVRCSICGSRWGVEVVDEENESLWALSGPTAEWIEAHPKEEGSPCDEFQPEDVLRQGIPPLPAAGIEQGTYFPVAAWQGQRHAAVLYVHRLERGEFDLPGDEYEDETEHLVLAADGQWTSTGSGGGCWVNVFDPPLDLLEKYVVLGTGITGHGDGDDAVSFTGGLCSSTVAAVETIDGHGTRTIPVRPERPVFVVGVQGPGQVRILDEHERVIHGHDGELLEYFLNSD